VEPEDLPPGLAAERRRAEELAPDVLGLDAEHARRLAAAHGVALRLLRPGDLMTADLRVTRLNAHLGADGRVVRTWLG
jgi:hypothetical protein